MNRADRLQPIASRCDVNRCERSDAILPGNYLVSILHLERRHWTDLIDDTQKIKEECKYQKILDTAKVICKSVHKFGSLSGMHILILFVSFNSSAVCTVYSHEYGEGGLTPVDISIKFCKSA